MKYWVALGVVFLCILPVHAGNWFEDFDAMPAGPIDTQPGWEGSHSAIDVAPGGALSSIHALDLPVSSLSTRTAEYDLLDVSCADKILRVSFKIQRANSSQSFRMNLIDGGATRLWVSTDTSDGTITLNGTDTGVPYGNSQYVTLTLFYDEDSNKASLDRNGIEILPWTDLGITHFTSLDTLQLRRVSGTTDTGSMLIDTLSIQAIDDIVLGWWRFEEGTGTWGTEESGQFYANTYSSQSGGGWDAASFALGALFDGDGVVDDFYARLNTRMDGNIPKKSLNPNGNWTLEFIVSFDGYDHCTLLDWTSATPPISTSGAWIRVDWASSVRQIDVFLRDSQQGDSDYRRYIVANVPRDGEYHHIAIVKDGTDLNAYIDYIPTTNVIAALDSSCDGTYSFATSARVNIGQEYDGDQPAQGGIRFDEFRFTQGTSLDRFLRINQPFIVGLTNVTETRSELTFVGTPWTLNSIMRKTTCTTATWTPGGHYSTPTNYIGALRTVTVTNPARAKGFFRIN
jgi:hypothetical protein